MNKNLDDIDLRLRSGAASTTEDVAEDVFISDDEEETKEKKLLRKLDWRIVPWIFCLYFLSVEDRANVGYAMTMNQSENHTLMDTSGLTAQQNNIGLGLFYVAYIVRVLIDCIAGF